MMDTKFAIEQPKTKSEYIQLLDYAIELADDLHRELDCIDSFLEAAADTRLAA